MGGNIFDGTIRLPKSRIDDAVDLVLSMLDNVFTEDELPQGYTTLKLVRSYSSKESFGDLDFVAIASPASILSILEDYGYEKSKGEISVNSNVVSFALSLGSGDETLQVDIICFPTKESANLASDYYAFNDLGNLVGRIYHSIGLKYGHDGITHIHRTGDHVDFEMNLSTNTRAIHEFIGLDHDRFLAGFETLEDIFNFVASSKYFRSEIYLLENRNNASRVRDRKRKTYMQFLDWCAANEHTFKEVFVEHTKSVYVDQALSYFGKCGVYATALRNLEVNRTIANKFNGFIIGEITGLSGVELGKFMSKLRQHINRELLFSLEADTIRAIVKDLHNSQI